VLAAGAGAVLSHRSAAALHGVRQWGGQRVDVTTPRRVECQPGIEIHRTRVLEVEARDGILATPLARTLVDLAATVRPDELAKALREADRQRKLDVAAIEAALERVRNRPGEGHAAMRAALDELRARGTQLTRSVLEDRFLALLDARGLPRPLTNVMIEGLDVDAAWPAQRLVAELDGWAHHHDRGAFQRDRERANVLLDAGWRVARWTHDDVVRRPAAVAARLAGLLAS
jgi:very-short-patch-repair endonuclease